MSTPATTLLELVLDFEKQVLDFTEHLQLATKMIDDDKVKAILAHALDEENERLQRLKELQQTLNTSTPPGWPPGASLPTITAAPMPARPEATARPDKLPALTVGSLFGSRQ